MGGGSSRRDKDPGADSGTVSNLHIRSDCLKIRLSLSCTIRVNVAARIHAHSCLCSEATRNRRETEGFPCAQSTNELSNKVADDRNVA